MAKRKSTLVRSTVRLEPDLQRAVEEAAADERRSVANFIRNVLSDRLSDRPAQTERAA